MGITNSNKIIDVDSIACDGSLKVTLALTAAPDIVSNPTDIALVLDYLEPFGQRIIGAGSGSPDYADITYKDGNGYYGFRLK